MAILPLVGWKRRRKHVFCGHFIPARHQSSHSMHSTTCWSGDQAPNNIAYISLYINTIFSILNKIGYLLGLLAVFCSKNAFFFIDVTSALSFPSVKISHRHYVFESFLKISNEFHTFASTKKQMALQRLHPCICLYSCNEALVLRLHGKY